MNILKIVLLVIAIDSALVGAAILWMPYAKTAASNPASESSPAAAIAATQSFPSEQPSTVANPTSSTSASPTASPTSATTASAPSAQPMAAAVSVSNLHQTLTVEQAYQRIPHSRTPFMQAQATGMTAAEAQAASDLFHWSDLAVVERIAQVDAIQQRQPYSSENYSVILSQMNALNVPETLAAPKQMIVAAIQEQKSYIEGLASQLKPVSPEDPLVQSSHQKILAAYGQLMQRYPQASESTKKSFFDHLCSLDFI
jgi:hypothetical protein